MDRYHALADATMISLLDRLDNLLDEIANEGFEVDYHVSCRMTHVLDETRQCEATNSDIITEWRTNTQPWFEWDICDQ